MITKAKTVNGYNMRIGELYKLRNGTYAKMVGYDDGDLYPVIMRNDEAVYLVNAAGYFASAEDTSELDVMEPAPAIVTFWVEVKAGKAYLVDNASAISNPAYNDDAILIEFDATLAGESAFKILTVKRAGQK